MFRKIIDKITKPFEENLRQKYGNSIKKRKQNYEKAKKNMVKTLVKKEIINEKSVKFHSILITFFGCGKFKYGPGSFSSAVTVLIWFIVSFIFFKSNISTSSELIFWLVIAIYLFTYGIIYIPLYSRNFENQDHPSIVIDEVVGQILTLCLTYPFIKKYYFIEASFLSKLIMLAHVFSCFVFFRFLDIVKPSYIGVIDRNMKSSFGIMLDDFVCGIVAAIINFVIFFIYENAVWQLHS